MRLATDLALWPLLAERVWFPVCFFVCYFLFVPLFCYSSWYCTNTVLTCCHEHTITPNEYSKSIFLRGAGRAYRVDRYRRGRLSEHEEGQPIMDSANSLRYISSRGTRTQVPLSLSDLIRPVRLIWVHGNEVLPKTKRSNQKKTAVRFLWLKRRYNE